LLETVAVGEVGQAVVIRNVMQLAFGAPARRDVVKLENEPGVGGGGIVEERAVQRDPDVALVAAHTAQLDRKRVLRFRAYVGDVTIEQRGVGRMQQCAKRAPQQLRLVIAEQRAKRL